jgi:hypothetical protein
MLSYQKSIIICCVLLQTGGRIRLSSFFMFLQKHIGVLLVAHIIANISLLPIEFFVELSDFLVQEYLLDLSISNRAYSSNSLLFFLQHPDMSYGTFLWEIIYTFIYFVIFIFALSGSLGICTEALRDGKGKIYHYFQYGFDFLHKTTLLFFVILSGLSLFVILFFWLIPLLKISWLTISLQIIVAVAMVGYLLGCLYAVVILIAEKTRVLKSIELSFKLFRYDFWKVLFTGILFFPFIVLDIWLASRPEAGISSFKEFITSPFNDLLITLLVEPPVMFISSFIMLFLYFHHLKKRIKHELPPSVSTTSSWLPIRKN